MAGESPISDFADQRLHAGPAGLPLLVELQHLFHARGADRALEQEVELRHHHRLDHIVVGTRLHRGHGGLRPAVAGHHDALGERVGFAQALQQLDAGEPGQPVVRDHHVRVQRFAHFQRLFGRGASLHFPAVAHQVGGDVARLDRVILDDQYCLAHGLP
jgi:hypothetical protein